MPKRAFIVAAARTRIAPRGGLHRDCPLSELALPVLQVLAQSLGNCRPKSPRITGVLLGNALAAGGNPARLCALAALEDSLPALTVDSQCCSGMDAIHLARHRLLNDEHQVIIAGGVESVSQAPARFRRTEQGLQAYTQAQFAPWPERDPPVLEAAQTFAEDEGILRSDQEAWAIESHKKALRFQPDVALRDPFARELSAGRCARMPALVRSNAYSITAATVAPDADAAAAVMVVGERQASEFPWAIEIVATAQAGGAPERPAAAGVLAAKKLLEQLPRRIFSKISVVEIMESFAAQTLHNLRALHLPQEIVNARGGLLAAGHAIGASGAILVGNLALRLLDAPRGAYGLALIPAAGGLGSAILCRRP
jgi:acetyl-CoA C-acetyltransferase